jgi:5-enolpyruvylshikimate-3-phosphate synthase
MCAPAFCIRTQLTGLRTLRVKETDRIAALANELRKVGCIVETGDDWITITPPATRSAHAVSDNQRKEDTDSAADDAESATKSGSSSCWSSDPAFDRSIPPSDPASTKQSIHNPVIIETYNDHRMAMSFAILGLNPPNGRPLAICNPKCVAKSYPTFWKDFVKLYQ